MTRTFILPLILALIPGAWAKERALFDGKSLQAFEFAPGAWEIEADGSVVCRMQETKDKKGKTRLRGNGLPLDQG